MAFSGPVADRQLIRERYDAYACAAMQGDQAAWLGCFAEDCAWVIDDGTYRGKDGLAAKWDEIFVHVGQMGFFNQIGDIAIDGDNAKARAFVREIVQMPDGAIYKIVGRYDDQLVKSDGDWFFAERTYTILIRE